MCVRVCSWLRPSFFAMTKYWYLGTRFWWSLHITSNWINHSSGKSLDRIYTRPGKNQTRQFPEFYQISHTKKHAALRFWTYLRKWFISGYDRSPVGKPILFSSLTFHMHIMHAHVSPTLSSLHNMPIVHPYNAY